MKKIPVRELMTDKVVAVRSDAPLSTAVALLAGNKMPSLPVVDSRGHLVGIISESDLFLKERNAPFSTEKIPTLLGRIIDEHELDQLDNAKQIPVEQVMCGEVETATGDATLEEVAMRMMRLGISNMPVVSEGRLVGMVRRIDILNTIFATNDAAGD